jgi:hypothetical protein
LRSQQKDGARTVRFTSATEGSKVNPASAAL